LQNFTYDRTFAEAPSAQSDGAWRELFPTKGGFFKNPKLAPGLSGLAVFHQLHCLVRGVKVLCDSLRY
jgi:hypothetical protein